MWNDPLGALAKANATLKEKAKSTAESIKNNENLKQSLANAKEKSYNGFVSAQAMAGTAATSMKDNANTLMEKNYHGQLAEGVGKAMTNA
jgi:hypothetical protein